MKKLARCIITLTALAFAASSAIAQTAQQRQQQQLASSNNAFACDLYAQLKGTEGNLFFSPFSVSAVLAMTYAGAKGDTAAQMQKVLRFPTTQANTHEGFAALLKHFDYMQRDPSDRSQWAAKVLLNNFDDVPRDGNMRLNMANSLWPQKGAPLLESFLSLVRQNYGVEITPVDYKNAEAEARAQINRWVKKKTQDKIKNLIGDPLSPYTRLVLVNAVYFKGKWQEAFNPRDTFTDSFFTADGLSVQTSLMQQKKMFKYAAFTDCQAIELPYKNGEISMLVVLPVDKSPAGLTTLESHLYGGLITDWKAQMKYTTVQVFLPMFKFEWGTASFGKALQKLGMSDAFVFGKADFSGMNGNRDFFISDVMQKAFVAVDESGTEAAAATATALSIGAGFEPPPPVFRADHPFLFFIQDNATGSILFMGRMMNPAAQ